MKSAVLNDIGKIRIEHRKKPTCKDGEVLIKVKACAICRTDMKCTYYGQRDLMMPRVLGHELSGEVVETGKNVDGIMKGDAVQIFPGIACGECEYCLNGMDNLCDHIKITGFNHDGGFQEYMLIPAIGVKNGIINKIPKTVSYEEAALVEPIACSINMFEAMNIKSKSTLLIMGLGRLGIINYRLAEAMNIKKIIAIEPNPERRKAAKLLGITDIYAPEDEFVLKKLIHKTPIDYIVNCTANPEAVNQGFKLLRKKGTFGSFSGISKKSRVPIDFNAIHYKELKVVGGYGCTLASNRKALMYLGLKKIKVDDLISKKISLPDLKRGLEEIYHEKNNLTIMVVN
jgi:L-iditol 2-dehydrogenase